MTPSLWSCCLCEPAGCMLCRSDDLTRTGRDDPPLLCPWGHNRDREEEREATWREAVLA